MSTSTKKLSGSIDNITIYNYATIIPTFPLPYLTQTYFDTAIKELLDSFNDNNSKQDAKFKEIISKQDAKFERQLQTL